MCFFPLFRSQKSDLHNERYILELDRCSSLDHLTGQKLIPEFIKKVSPMVRGQLTRFAVRTGVGWLRAVRPYSTGWGRSQGLLGPGSLSSPTGVQPPTPYTHGSGWRWLRNKVASPLPRQAGPWTLSFKAGLAVMADRPGPTAQTPFKPSRWCDPHPPSLNPTFHLSCGSSLPWATFLSSARAPWSPGATGMKLYRRKLPSCRRIILCPVMCLVLNFSSCPMRFPASLQGSLEFQYKIYGRRNVLAQTGAKFIP